MNTLPVNVRNLNADNVTFVVGQAKTGRNPSINFKHEGQNLQILVPRTGFPAGVLIKDSENGSTSYTLIGSLKGCDPYGKDKAPEVEGDIGRFYNFLLDLDERIIQQAVENSVKWFGKKRSEEAIRDSYKKILSVSVDKIDGEYVPNGKYPPSFRIKLPVYDNKVSTEIVDSSNNPVYATPESLASIFPKGVDVKMVISGSIYVIAGGSFGVTWRLNRAQVFPKARITAADIFASEDVEEEITPTATPVQEEPVHEEFAQEDIPSTPLDQPVQAQIPAAPVRKRRVNAGGI